MIRLLTLTCMVTAMGLLQAAPQNAPAHRHDKPLRHPGRIDLNHPHHDGLALMNGKQQGGLLHQTNEGHNVHLRLDKRGRVHGIDVRHARQQNMNLHVVKSRKQLHRNQKAMANPRDGFHFVDAELAQADTIFVGFVFWNPYFGNTGCWVYFWFPIDVISPAVNTDALPDVTPPDDQ